MMRGAYGLWDAATRGLSTGPTAMLVSLERSVAPSLNNRSRAIARVVTPRAAARNERGRSPASSNVASPPRPSAVSPAVSPTASPSRSPPRVPLRVSALGSNWGASTLAAPSVGSRRAQRRVTSAVVDARKRRATEVAAIDAVLAARREQQRRLQERAEADVRRGILSRASTVGGSRASSRNASMRPNGSIRGRAASGVDADGDVMGASSLAVHAGADWSLAPVPLLATTATLGACNDD